MTMPRRQFGYNDLEASDAGGSSGRMSISIEDVVSEDSQGKKSLLPKWLQQSNKKSFILATALFGIAVMIVVAVTSSAKNADESLKEQLQETSSLVVDKNNDNNDNDDNGGEKRRILSYEELNKFHPRGFKGTWISDTEYYFEENNDLKILDMESNGETTTVLSSVRARGIGLRPFYNRDTIKFSADKKYMLAQTDAIPIYRRSSFGLYSVCRLDAAGKVGTVIHPLAPSDITKDEERKKFTVRLAVFAPKGNSLAYVDGENNLYYRRSVEAQDEKLTDDGDAEKVFNGVPDWVFEEEVFEDKHAIWWAPDASSLLYGSFNDTEVEPVLLQTYGTWDFRHMEQYPHLEDVYYPKVGTANPVSSLWLADFSGDQISKKQIPPPEKLVKKSEEQPHFSHVAYADGNLFAVQWFNRLQDRTVVTACKVNSMDNCREIFYEEMKDGWLDYKYKIIFDPRESATDGDRIPDFLVVWQNKDLKEKYRQLLLVTPAKNEGGEEKRQFLTDFKADVKEVLKWSSDGTVYFTASLPDEPGALHVYKLNPYGPQTEDRKAKCVSCDMKLDAAEIHNRTCKKFGVDMSADGSYYAMSCLGPDTPYTCLHSKEGGDRMVKVYQANSALDKTVKGYDMPRVRMISVPVKGFESQKVRVKLYLPPDLDESKKYPLVIYAYGGPSNQQVEESFAFTDVSTYLAGAKDHLYAVVDPVGSGGQGDVFRHAMYHNFGGPEVESTIETAKYLQRELNFVDESKTAIWGWSYGGFLSLSVLTHESNKDVITCGASVAPVVDWRYMCLLCYLQH